MYVGNSQGTEYYQVSIKLYDLNYNLIYSGTSAGTGLGSPFGGYTPNVVADMTDGNNDTPNPTFGPIVPRSYYLRVGNYFTFLNIPSFNQGSGGADFLISVINDVFNVEFDNRGITLGTTVYYWVEHTITVKNSFGGGNIKVDGVQYNNIGVNGKTFTWEENSFPHTLEAIDQQPAGFTYNQGFTQWSGNSSSTNRTISIDAGNGTYTAIFSNQFNITFQNSFSDATGGVINVSGQHNAPYQTTALEVNGIYASAVTQTFNGIRYDFDHWTGGSTEGTNHHFSPSDHTTYTAYFVGTPVNVNRNLNFEASNPRQPITVNWNDHPNSNVTYKIWRKYKYQQQATSSPQLIGSVDSDTHSFIDYDFYGTNLGYTDWKLWYDVKAYFTLDGTSSADDYVQVFSNGLIPKKPDNLEDNITVSIKENKIDNYPNPFNPSTVIRYQLVNPGFVTIKIYNSIGQEIKTLVNREQAGGIYEVNFNVDNLASGIYYYRILANGFTAAKKMILTK